MLNFTISATCGNARRGVLRTAHGEIQTPAFMPVGTAATVKAMTNEMVKQTGAEIILGNTYHLMLRPTAERIAKFGGPRNFMKWDGPILTDSGGYQVMSLSALRKIKPEGVYFRSHLDGSEHLLSPERSIEIQHLLDATITMIFDECTPYPADHTTSLKSMQLSLSWAQRSRSAFNQREGYGQFGIVQGGMYPDLREKSAIELNKMGFDGMAVGGLAVGEGQEKMFEVLDFTFPHLPENKPRYLMGVGKPADIVGAVARGMDMFDCVLPTRSGRNAQAFMRDGSTLNLRNAKYADDESPLDETSACPASNGYSKAYLHHLFRCKEILGAMLLTWHNIHVYQELMKEIRQSIEDGTFGDMQKRFLSKR